MERLAVMRIGMVLMFFAPPAAMALDDFRLAAVFLDGDGEGKRGTHGKKKGK